MKQFIILFLTTIIAVLTSGCATDNDEIIDNAEQLLANGLIDSAYITINNIYAPETLDARQQARYALVVGQVHNYRGEALSEDSLLCAALDYYQKLNPTDSAKLIQSTILASKHFWWKGEKQKAYNTLEKHISSGQRTSILLALCKLASNDYDYPKFNKYLSLLFNDNSNNDLSFLVRYNLGLTTYYMGNLEAANIELNGIEKYAHLPQDTTTYWQLTLRSQADITSDSGNQPRAIELQNKALEHFSATNDSTEMAISLASLARYYLLMDKIPEAERYLQLADKISTDKFRNDLSYSSYCQILHILISYAKKRDFNFRDWAIFVNRIQDNAEHNRKITEAKEKANNRLTERNYKITITSQRQQLIASYIIIILILVIAGTITYIWRRKKLIAEKEEEIETLHRLIAETQNSDSDVRDDRFFKKIMLQQLGIIKIAATNPTSANQELLKQMQQIANKNVEVNSLLNWNDLYKAIDYIYDNYYTLLAAKYSNTLNEKELQLCCLLKANFSTKEISILTQQSVRTVYQRKTQIRQKLGLEEKADITDII